MTLLRTNSMKYGIFSDVSYTNIVRTPSHTLPISMTLVACYGSEEGLIDCDYHEYTDDRNYSTDVSISCHSSTSDSPAACSNNSTSNDPTADSNGVSIASLTVAVICAVAVVILVAILIVRRKKKKYTTR